MSHMRPDFCPRMFHTSHHCILYIQLYSEQIRNRLEDNNSMQKINTFRKRRGLNILCLTRLQIEGVCCMILIHI